MRGMIGYCGLDCEACDAYLATIHDDQALRRKNSGALGRAQSSADPAGTHQLRRLPCGWCKDGILRADVCGSSLCAGEGRGNLRQLRRDGDLRKCGRNFRQQPLGAGQSPWLNMRKSSREIVSSNFSAFCFPYRLGSSATTSSMRWMQ